jgi:hypothetical protein
MAPEARVVHRTRGRLRLRIPSRVRDQAYFEHVCQALSESSAVAEVVANPTTASVLVRHDDDAQVILTLGAERGLFEVAPSPPARPPVLERSYTALQSVDRQLTDRSRQRLDLPTAAFYGLAAAGTLQLLRGDVLPAALTLYSTALGVLLAVGRPTADQRPFGRSGSVDTPSDGNSDGVTPA